MLSRQPPVRVDEDRSRVRKPVTGRQALTVVVTTAVVVLAVLMSFWLFQRRLVYLPHRGPVPPAATVLPGAEDVTFTTDDGLVLHGWFVPAVGGEAVATVLVCNGNAGDRSLRAPLAAGLSRAGMSVLLFDYRGFGDNPGRPSERGLLADARGARDYLAGRPDVDPGRLVYFGESLGAAVAVALATGDVDGTQRRPAALVLRSPFTTLSDIGRLHYPYLPVRMLLWDRFVVSERIARVDVPVLVVAGDRDRIVPASLSRRVYDAANQPRRFVLIPEAGHNDERLLAGSRLLQEVASFVRASARRDGPSPA